MNLDQNTSSLIVAAKLDSPEALNKLFAQHQSRILRIVRIRFNKDLRQKLKLQSMDIVQEVFMYAFEHLKEFEPKSQGHFLNWLSKKVEHYMYDRLDYIYRKKRNAPELSLDQETTEDGQADEMKIQIADEGTTPSQFAVRKESELLIDNLLELLEPEEKELIIQKDLEEQTFVEIGENFNISEEAARKRYSRAFKKLIELSEEKIKPIIAEQSFRQYNNES